MTSQDPLVQYNLPADARDYLDVQAFASILEMDEEDDTRDFSNEIIVSYCNESAAQIAKTEELIKQKKLNSVRSYADLLSGQASTIGAYKVHAIVMKIYYLSCGDDEKGKHHDGEQTTEETLEKIIPLIPLLKTEVADVTVWFKAYIAGQKKTDA